MEKRKAFVTGITGQDGSWLADFLLGLDSIEYEVYGMKRRTATESTANIRHLLGHDRFHVVDGDLLDSSSISKAIRGVGPDEVYNLGAQSFVKSSFSQAELTGDITGLGVTRILEAIRSFAPDAKFYQASSSEMFGEAPPPQKEDSQFHPRSPYGVAKLYGYWMTVNARERDPGMFACNGILFNHDGERRGIEFVTQKIATAVAAIKQGRQDKLFLGNLEAKRDWGHAKDYVEAMWLMLQQDEPDDYVVATGEAHTVREFCEIAFGHVGLDYSKYVEIDPKFFRPTEVNYLLGDASKAREKLGWVPKIGFQELVTCMVDAAMARASSPEVVAGRNP